MSEKLHDNHDAPFTWPADGHSRVPFEVFCEQEIFSREDELLFRGNHWNYLGLEAEVPEPGDYTTGYVGRTPYILIRDVDGVLRAMVNRCAHRGAEVVRVPRGNATHLTCIYHNWTYDQQGRLTGVTLERGRGGIGGFAADFDKTQLGLRRFTVGSIAGVVFGCLGDNPPPLEDYLGPAIVHRLERIMARPITITGYQRHTIRANWKFLMENSRDLYHAPQLHKFFGAFGIVQPTQDASVEMWHQGTHCLITIYEQPTGNLKPIGLEEPRVVSQKSALPDGVGLNIIGIFPNCLFTLAGSSFSIRQLRPKTPDRFEAFYTYFTYADDPACLQDHLFQNNQFGPAGYVAMEDAEVLEKIQARISQGTNKGTSLLEMDGVDTTPERIDHLITEGNLRSMWKGYSAFMGFDEAAPGAKR